MIFEVFLKDKRVGWTEHESCVPDAETVQTMLAAGLTVFIDGKPYAKKQTKTKTNKNN